MSLAARRSDELHRQRRQRYAKRIWPLGERVLYEMLQHLVDRGGVDQDFLDLTLDRFADLDPAILKALDADKIPAPPLHVVGGRR